MLIISREKVLQSGIAEPKTAQQIIEQTLIQKANHKAVSAQEIAMIPDRIEAGAFYSLPAYLKEDNVAGIKWTSHVPKSSLSDSYTHPVILLNDLNTGIPKALLEGELISGLRTAAVSATAIKYLAEPRASSLLICGSGYQARQQLNGILPFLPNLKEVHLWSRSAIHAEQMEQQFSSLFAKLNINSRVHHELPERLDFAEIIIGVTSASSPYLQPSHFSKGHLYLHIGMRDIEAQAIEQFDEIVCDDFKSGVLASSQSLFHLARTNPALEEKTTLLEDIILNKAAIRQNSQQMLMFNAFGLSIFDLALANVVVKQLERQDQSDTLHYDLFKER